MKRNEFVPWFLATLICVSFLPSAAVAQQTDEEMVIQTLKGMWAAMENGDVDTYIGYVHPDYTVFGENDPYLAAGRNLELRNTTSYLQNARDVHTEMHQPKVTIRGDVAWITYYWTDTGVTSEGSFSTRGKSTRIFVREGGRWLCIHAHFTAVP